MRTTVLPFSKPCLGEEEQEAVRQVIESGWITTGKKVKEFEDGVRAHVGGAGAAIAVNSCTAAMEIALTVADIGGGGVLVPTWTFCSTANVVRRLSGFPILCDVTEDLLLDMDKLEDKKRKDVVAVMPVHFAGMPVDMESLYVFAHDARLKVIEDAAHAFGSEYKVNGRWEWIGGEGMVGLPNYDKHCMAVAFSFYATKNLTTGEGGMIMLNGQSAGLEAKYREWVLHGMSRDAWNRYNVGGNWYYEVLEAGYKCNLTDMAAAMGVEQLKKFGKMQSQRRKLYWKYVKAFDEPKYAKVKVRPDPRKYSECRNSSFHLMVVELELEAITIDRAQFINELIARNISPSVHFIPLHHHPYYQRLGWKPDQFPVSEKMFPRVVSLPLSSGMTERDVDDVVEAVEDIFKKFGR